MAQNRDVRSIRGTLKKCQLNKFSQYQTKENDNFVHGETSANLTKPGPSFQLQRWSFACCTILVLSVKLTNLKLKTRPKKLLGSLLLVIALPVLFNFIILLSPFCTYFVLFAQKNLITLSLAPSIINLTEWKRINCKQSTRWDHLSCLKASAFFTLQKHLVSCMKGNNLYSGLVTPSSG